jgi:hypothetical protein
MLPMLMMPPRRIAASPDSWLGAVNLASTVRRASRFVNHPGATLFREKTGG